MTLDIVIKLMHRLNVKTTSNSKSATLVEEGATYNVPAKRNETRESDGRDKKPTGDDERQRKQPSEKGVRNFSA